MNNPYDSPQQPVGTTDAALPLPRHYGGIGRLSFLGLWFGLILLNILIAVFIESNLAGLLGPLLGLASFALIYFRLENIGVNPWWCLAFSLRLVPKVCLLAIPLAFVACLLVVGCSGESGTDTGDVASPETPAGETPSTASLLSSEDVAQEPNFSAALPLDSELQPLEQQVKISIPSPLLSREGLAMFATHDGDLHRSGLGLQRRDRDFPWSPREFPPRAYGPNWNDVDAPPRSTPVFLQRHGESLVERRLSASVLPPGATGSFAESLNEARHRLLQAFSLDEFTFDMESRRLDEMVRNVESMADLVGPLEANPRSPEAYFADDRDARVRLIGLFGERAAEAVPAIARVASHDPSIRLACAGALANIGKDSVGAIKDLLNEGSVDEKKFAVAVVGLLGERASACVPELLALHESLEFELVDAAIWGLAAIGPAAAEAAPALVQRLEQDQQLRSRAAGALWCMGPAAVDETRKLLTSENAEVRSGAVIVLGHVGKDRPEVATDLGGMLNDADPLVQRVAIDALNGFGPAAKTVVPQLVAALSGRHAVPAARTLGSLGSAASAAVPVLTQVATTATEAESYPAKRWVLERQLAAMDAITAIGTKDPATIAALIGLLKKPQMNGNPPKEHPASRAARGRAVATLGSLGQAARPAVPSLVTLIEEPLTNQRGREETVAQRTDTSKIFPNRGFSFGTTLKLLAIQALGEIGEDSASVTKICNECLQDPDPAIRVAAVNSLVALGRREDRFVEVCKEAMLAARSVSPSEGSHDELVTHYLAAEAMIALGDSSIPALIEVIDSPIGHGTEQREAAIYALARVGKESHDARRSLIKVSLYAIISELPVQKAFDAMGEDRPAEVIALAELLNDELVAQDATEALVKYRTDAAPAMPTLIDLLDSANPELRVRAAQVLSAIGAEVDGTMSSLATALKDDEYRVRRAAFIGLCRTGVAAAPYVNELVQVAIDSRMKLRMEPFEVNDYLKQLGADSLLSAFLPELGDEKYRGLCFMTLMGTLNDSTSGHSAELLAEYADDPKVEVRQLVVKMLAWMGKAAEPALPELKQALRDDDPAVSFSAMTAVLSIISLDDLDDLIAGFPDVNTQHQPDPLEGTLDQLISLLTSREGVVEGNQILQPIREKTDVRYWMNSLRSPDPRVRFIAATVCRLRQPQIQSVADSILVDPNSSPALKAAARTIIERGE